MPTGILLRCSPMFEAKELLKAYLDGVLRLSGAAGASVFVPTPWNRASQAILIHTGSVPPLPELADADTALAFSQRTATSLVLDSAAPYPGMTVLNSEAPGGALLPVPLITKLWQRVAAGGEEGKATPRRATDRSIGIPAAGWVGLRFGPYEDEAPGGEGQDARARTTDFCAHLVALAGSLASYYVCLYGVLTDPLTGLPGRAELLGLLREESGRARERRQSYCLLFVNPDDFDRVNDQHGRKVGDLVIREIVARLQAAVRRTDPIARYGAAVFAVGLEAVRADAGLAVAEKVRRHLSEAPYLDGALRLEFSAGIAAFDPEEPDVDAQELVRRADIALGTAKTNGGATSSLFRSDSEALPPRDRLNGIFTGDTEKDYRNMGLLWDALSAIAASASATGLAALVVENTATLRPGRVALFSVEGDSAEKLLCGRRSEDGEQRLGVPLAEHDLLADERALARRAAHERRALEGSIVARDGAHLVAYAVPLLVDQRVVGSLLIAGARDTLRLGPPDLPFLHGLASQIALALDHARLAEQQRTREEHERRQLRSELHDLRSALHKAKVVYRSEQFERLLAVLRRIAPTDATVLITGESGTGKELIAHTVHELSRRRHKPLVIVDCGSIPATLIESELFGHQKGAYTGALEQRAGRIVQADGGTLLLDEIGELPLEVQAKLLRFVQEKQFTTLGSASVRRVDVRILAATNRDLEAEARAGRFREDLYHRLNVVTLDVPPLRERPDDILLLARHFLDVCAVQYQKPTRGFTPEAEAMILADSWPGNVRELQNRIIQAVLLEESDLITPQALRLPRGGQSAAPFDERRSDERVGATHASAQSARQGGHEAVPSQASRPAQAGAAASGEPPVDPWTLLRQALAREIQQALAKRPSPIPPLGRWLEDDLLQEGYEAASRVGRRAAALLGVAERTLARRLAKAEYEAATTVRTESWPDVRAAARAVVRAAGNGAETALVDRAAHLAVTEIRSHVPHDRRLAAQLLGVSLPTFRLRAAATESRQVQLP
jgi:hydrogenase-4 transcriptional activator